MSTTSDARRQSLRSDIVDLRAQIDALKSALTEQTQLVVDFQRAVLGDDSDSDPREIRPGDAAALRAEVEALRGVLQMVCDAVNGIGSEARQ